MPRLTLAGDDKQGSQGDYKHFGQREAGRMRYKKQIYYPWRECKVKGVQRRHRLKRKGPCDGGGPGVTILCKALAVMRLFQITDIFNVLSTGERFSAKLKGRRAQAVILKG